MVVAFVAGRAVAVKNQVFVVEAEEGGEEEGIIPWMKSSRWTPCSSTVRVLCGGLAVAVLNLTSEQSGHCITQASRPREWQGHIPGREYPESWERLSSWTRARTRTRTETG